MLCIYFIYDPQVAASGIIVNCMKNVVDKNCFRWPATPYQISYRPDEIICLVDAPSPVNRRGDYSLSDDNFDMAATMFLKHN